MINRKKIILYTILSSMLLSLNGCGKEKEYDYDNEDVEYTTEYTTENTTEYTTYENTTEYYTENTTENIEDSTEFNCFENEKNEIKKYINEQNYEIAKQKGKEYFVTIVDFIFYEKRINGITFDELNEENKNITYNNLRIIDSFIMSIDEDYKESLSEKYNKVKDFTSEKYNDAKDIIKEKIGEENCDKINDVKEKTENVIKDKSEKAKTKVKNWYEDFRK